MQASRQRACGGLSCFLVCVSEPECRCLRPAREAAWPATPARRLREPGPDGAGTAGAAAGCAATAELAERGLCDQGVRRLLQSALDYRG